MRGWDILYKRGAKLATSHSQSSFWRENKLATQSISREEVSSSRMPRHSKFKKRQFHPCGICGQDAGNNCVGCGSCKRWIHFSCAGIRHDQAVTLAGAESDYYCHDCTEDERGNFDFARSIARLGAATRRKREPQKKPQEVAEVEEIIIERTSLPPPPRRLTYHGEVDTIAETYLGAMMKVPLKTTGGGNCLYNAVSLAVYGHEGNATQLRVRTCIELNRNVEYYKDQYVKELSLVSPDLENVCMDSAVAGRGSLDAILDHTQLPP